MARKMQPFWYFLRPPYTYPCWYNLAENCSDWTIQSPLSCLVDTVNKKQGIGSIKIHQPKTGESVTKSATLAAVQCNPFMGFWARVDQPSMVASTIIDLLDAAGNLTGIRFFFTPPYTKPLIELRIWDPVHGMFTSGPYDYTNLAWIWAEVKVDYITKLVSWYFNGVYQTGFSGWNLGQIQTVRAIFNLNNEAMDLWLDWLRWFAAEEYPPTYPY